MERASSARPRCRHNPIASHGSIASKCSATDQPPRPIPPVAAFPHRRAAKVFPQGGAGLMPLESSSVSQIASYDVVRSDRELMCDSALDPSSPRRTYPRIFFNIFQLCPLSESPLLRLRPPFVRSRSHRYSSLSEQEKKISVAGCVDKDDFMGFSVHINAKPDQSTTQRLENIFIHPFCTDLSDVWITCGERFVSTVRRASPRLSDHAEAAFSPAAWALSTNFSALADDSRRPFRPV